MGTGGQLSVRFAASADTTSVAAPERFTLDADEGHAPGALIYQVDYGDGATDQNDGPTMCQSGAAGPEHDSWHLSHGYQRPGTYVATATVSANCTTDKATVRLRLEVI